jgi:hypothetical protein
MESLVMGALRFRAARPHTSTTFPARNPGARQWCCEKKRSIDVRKRTSILAVSALLIGLSAIGNVMATENAPNATQSVAQSESQAAHPYHRGTTTQNDWRNSRGNDPVTVRPYGSDDDGYRASRAWWKDN